LSPGKSRRRTESFGGFTDHLGVVTEYFGDTLAA
jgi:hypothetical protein